MKTNTVRVVLISAIASGQGKTTVTAALARKLARQGQRVRVFKTGPDFLDPMMLERASGHPVYTLDLWMVGLDQCRAQLAQAAMECDVILIEGVMGLYDGTPSSADLARAFGVPVMVVLDASAMAQTAGALVLGLRDYGPVDLAGVIANRVGSAGHARMVADALRDVSLFATLPKQAQALPERHLGLVAPDEVEAIDAVLDQLAEQLAFDGEAWNALRPTRFGSQSPLPFAPQETPLGCKGRVRKGMGCQDAATPIPHPTSPLKGEEFKSPAIPPKRALSGKTIAVARDAAFAFIYPANLDCLHALGAQLVFFSPIANEPVPAGADAVYLPGGYPELHAQVLSQASRWQDSIRTAHARDLPIVAECGGMMTLAESLTDQDGASWPMAGLLPGRIAMQTRLAALGSQGWATRHGELRGHAFHYSRFETTLTPLAQARKHPSGNPGEAIYRRGALTASYFHAYFPACPAAVAALFLGADPL